MATVLLVDDRAERIDACQSSLDAAGYRTVTSAAGDLGTLAGGAAPDAVVLAAGPHDVAAWDVLAESRRPGALLADVPVIVIVGAGALEDGLRAAIEGAVRCLAEPVDAKVLAAAVGTAVGSGAPPVSEQRRRARLHALEVLARIEARGAASDDDVYPRLVHLTRLEHVPARASAPDPLADARGRLATLTPKQRSLLSLVEAEGGVTAAAARLSTSRGNVYAGLRRIVHRLGMRNTGELLRLLGSGELLRSARS